MKKLSKIVLGLLLATLVSLGGCFQASNCDDADLRTVPVTNNPHVSGAAGQMGMPY
ncbi:MAG: hypothetical protein S4CHLAM37_10770 [Chlamydiia bacterium]|nr:hypothetical protein [Chlamydiia bacterium]